MDARPPSFTGRVVHLALVIYGYSTDLDGVSYGYGDSSRFHLKVHQGRAWDITAAIAITRGEEKRG